MIKEKKGECHPIFNLDYLAENIASLIETVVLFVEALFIVFFLINILINIYPKYAMDFVPTLIIDSLAIDFFAQFKVTSSVLHNLIALIASLSVYVISHIYFEYVKYNLHPREAKKPQRKLQTQA